MESWSLATLLLKLSSDWVIAYADPMGTFEGASTASEGA